MNTAQRKVYFRLWSAACRVQGWSPKDEALRRDATLSVTGESSTSKLGQHQITMLFEWLKLQADPDNLTKAMPVANPELSEENDRRRQLNHVIAGLSFADSYISRVAKGFMRQEGVSVWHNLSVASIEKLRHTLTTRARNRDAAAGKRPAFEPRSEPYYHRDSARKKRERAKAEPVTPRPGMQEVIETEELMPF